MTYNHLKIKFSLVRLVMGIYLGMLCEGYHYTHEPRAKEQPFAQQIH